jgi:cytosine permease
VLIVDQLLLRRGSDVALAYRPTAFAAWILAAAAATASHELVPGSIDALVGIVAAAAGYTAMEAVVKYAARRSTTAPAGVRADAA